MKTKEVQIPTTFQVWVEKNRNKAISWFDTQSEFYTRIMEEPTTRLTALLVNLIAVCLMVAAITVEGDLTVSFVATLCAGYLAKRLNATDNKQHFNK